MHKLRLRNGLKVLQELVRLVSMQGTVYSSPFTKLRFYHCPKRRVLRPPSVTSAPPPAIVCSRSVTHTKERGKETNRSIAYN